MRHNLVTNPTCEVDTTGWTQANAGAGTTTGVRMTSDGLYGVFVYYYRQTWTAVTTGTITSTGPIIGAPTALTVGVTGGQDYCISGYGRSSHAGRTAALVATFYDSTNTLVGSTATGATVDVSLGGWERLTVAGTAPAGATHAQVRLYAQGGTVWAVNDTFDLGGVLSEVGTQQALDYFSGSTPQCVWDGTANASTSTWLSLASSRLRLNYCLNPRAASSTTGWALSAGTGGTAAASNVNVSGCPDAGSAFQVLWSVAATGGSCGGYYYASTSHAGSVGGQWRGSAWARFSWACTAFVALYAYDKAGVNIGTHSMPAVAVAANAWTRFVTDDYVPPAQTDRLLLLIYRTTGGVPAAGDTFQMTACVIEPSVPVAGLTVAPTGILDPGFFSGETVNGVWQGTAHASVSQALAVGVRPNFPTMEVTAWPGVSPTLLNWPSTPGRWLTDRTKAFTIGRGRQYELAQDEAASGTLTLNNSDGAVTGGAYGCTPITSAQVRAEWNGTIYDVWTGLIRSWPQHDDDPSTAWAEAELTDSFEPLANRAMGSLLAEEIQHQTAPDAWYPMNEPQSSTSIGSLVASGPSAPLVSIIDSVSGNPSPAPFALGGTSVFAGTSESVLTLANATGATGHASQYQVAGPQNVSGYSMPFGAPWGVGVFVRMTAGASVVWSALDSDGSVMAAIEVNAGTQTITGYERLGGRGASYVTMPCATGAMLLGCYVHMGHDGTNAFLYVYGVTSTGTLYAVQAGGAVAITTGSSQWVAWGQAFFGSSVYYSSNADMQLCHGTIWTTSPPAPYTNPILVIATAGLNAFYGYKAKDQLAFVGACIGVNPLIGDASDGQPLGQIRDTKGAAGLDAMRAITGDYLGRLLMDKAGNAVWQSVHHGMGKPTQWTLGGNSGEQPYTGSPGFDFDPTYVYNDVQVQRPDTKGVAQQVTSTKAIQRATNPASEVAYFQRVLQVDSNVRDDADALAMAQYLVTKYGQPSTRVRTVRFEPSSNPALWPFVLAAELGDTVTLNHRALGRANRVLTLSIQSIDHTVDAQAGTWVTEMEMAPWSSDWVLAAMHTTVKATVAAGVNTITLNPLPDSATNPSEASLGVGTTITLSPGTANAETMTIASVTSTPTAGATGYTGITLTFTANTTKAHTVGDVACDPLPSGVTDATTWDAFSVLESTTVLSI